MRGSSQKGLGATTTSGDQVIEVDGFPLEGPETAFVPAPMSPEALEELAAYAAVTKQSIPRAASQLIEIGLRAQSQWTGVARVSLRDAIQGADERRAD
jgi:hypothetical protein